MWLILWWAWCAAAAVLHALPLRAGHRMLVIALVVVVLPLLTGLLPFSPAAVPGQLMLEQPLLWAWGGLGAAAHDVVRALGVVLPLPPGAAAL